VALGLVVNIKGDTKDLDKSLKSASGGVVGFGGDLGATAAKILPVAGAVVGVTAAIVGMTKAAEEDRAEQAKLNQVIQAAGLATGDYNAVVDEAIAKGQDRAFSDSETRDALAGLITATGDLDAATANLALAQDVARFANVDLATASDAVAKANAGQAGSLLKLMPGLTKTTSGVQAMAQAAQVASGQADLYANSAEGMATRGADAFGEIGETIGSAFLPVMDEVLPALIPVVQQLGKLVTAILPLIIPLVKVLAAVLGLVARALGVLVGWLVQLVEWLMKGVEWVGKILDKLGPLHDLAGFVGGIVGGLSTGAAVGGPALRGATRQSSSGGGGSVVINITATGDSLATEAAVARALRRTTRLNAGAPGWST
jgi:hypothetical protein